jgi:hypothetical protein
MSYIAQGQHFKGFFIFDDEMTPMEFMNLQIDPDHGVVNGTSNCGYVATGIIWKKGHFQFKLADPDFNERFCWGKLSQDRKNVRGAWGWENKEAED